MQLLLRLSDIGSMRQSDFIGYPEHMGIYRDRRYPESVRQNHIGRLASYPRQARKLLHRLRHLALKTVRKLPEQPVKVPRLSMIKPKRMDIILQLFLTQLQQRIQIRMLRKQLFRHPIDLPIRCLRAENRRRQ